MASVAVLSECATGKGARYLGCFLFFLVWGKPRHRDMSAILPGRWTALSRESDVEVGLGVWEMGHVGKQPPFSTLFAQRPEAKVGGAEHRWCVLIALKKFLVYPPGNVCRLGRATGDIGQTRPAEQRPGCSRDPSPATWCRAAGSRPAASGQQPAASSRGGLVRMAQCVGACERRTSRRDPLQRPQAAASWVIFTASCAAMMSSTAQSSNEGGSSAAHGRGYILSRPTRGERGQGIARAPAPEMLGRR
ncbi:hypothetical protein J3E74DRAFT_294322 [Bipolaris maydis]|nr:hypothetical protein J3E74DRAFT_294322 [Bipolaris maydis]